MQPYHIGFGREQFGEDPPTVALLSGDPGRSQLIAAHYLQGSRLLSDYRGLTSYCGYLANGKAMLVATSGMGASSLSIVVNELVQVGIKHIIRVGTCGSIQPQINLGDLVITQAALCRQGAANEIAPVEYPAAADPFLTVALAQVAQERQLTYHVGITASVDTFYEGQERVETSANPHLQPWLLGITDHYRRLNLLNYEMEAGTLFKMAGVYGFAAACVCAVIANRTQAEAISPTVQEQAIGEAIAISIKVFERLPLALI